MTDRPTLHAIGFTPEQVKWLQALETRIAELERHVGVSAARESSLNAYPSLQRFRTHDGSFQISVDDVQEMDAQQLRDVLTALRDKPEPNTSLRVLRLRVRAIMERMYNEAKEVKTKKR